MNHWYERQAAGSHTEGGWRVFWRGIDPARLPDIIGFALERENDFQCKLEIPSPKSEDDLTTG